MPRNLGVKNLYILSRNIVYFIILVVVFLWIGNSLYQKFYINSEKKPFWKGTDSISVCRVPYYSSDDCNNMLVTLIDEETAQINFPNGGSKVTEDLQCYFAAKIISNQPRYVFCRSWDNENQQWDFMPSWAYYPSTEDLIIEMEKLEYSN